MRTDLSGLLDGADYPVFVVTAHHEDEHAGCLVGFTSQVSIDPARLLVCLSVANHTYGVASFAPVLAVHLLHPDQADLAALFGSRTGDEIDKFAHCRWRPGPGGVRVLDGVAGWMAGAVLDRIPFGDHVGFVLDPLEAHRDEARGILTYQQVKDLSPGHPA